MCSGMRGWITGEEMWELVGIALPMPRFATLFFD